MILANGKVASSKHHVSTRFRANAWIAFMRLQLHRDSVSHSHSSGHATDCCVEDAPAMPRAAVDSLAGSVRPWHDI